MRVISQKGIGYTLDMPYEQVSIEVRASNIYVLCDATGGIGRVIASYSTPDKAEKVMTKLQGRYTEFVGTLLRTSRYPCAPGFRFPEDLEV